MLRTIGKFILYIVGAALAVSFVSGLVLTWVQKGPSAIDAYVWHQILGFGLLGLVVLMVYGFIVGASNTIVKDNDGLHEWAKRQKEEQAAADETRRRNEEYRRRQEEEEESRRRWEYWRNSGW